MDRGGVGQHAPRMDSRGGTGDKRGCLHLPRQRCHCLSLFCFLTDLDFCRNRPCLGTHCCFSSKIRGIQFSSQELLWRWLWNSMALEATLSSPVHPLGSRCQSILQIKKTFRLSNFCALCMLLCLFHDCDIAALTPWEETHILGPSNPFVGAVPSPGLPTHCLFVHPQVPSQLCQAAPARPPFRARQAHLSALILDGESCRTKALSEHCRLPIKPAGCRLQR